MSDLIRREDVLKKIQKIECEPAYQHVGEDWSVGLCIAESIVEEAESAEPERTVKVETVDTNSPHSQVYKCCKCGQYTHRTAWSRDVHYCPSCGARLEWK